MTLENIKEKVLKEILEIKTKHDELLDRVSECNDCNAMGMCDNHRFHVDLSFQKNDVLYGRLEGINETLAEIIKKIEGYIKYRGGMGNRINAWDVIDLIKGKKPKRKPAKRWRI